MQAKMKIFYKKTKFSFKCFLNREKFTKFIIVNA